MEEINKRRTMKWGLSIRKRRTKKRKRERKKDTKKYRHKE